jgi:hypothetical protein
MKFVYVEDKKSKREALSLKIDGRLQNEKFHTQVQRYTLGKFPSSTRRSTVGLAKILRIKTKCTNNL